MTFFRFIIAQALFVGLMYVHFEKFSFDFLVGVAPEIVQQMISGGLWVFGIAVLPLVVLVAKTSKTINNALNFSLLMTLEYAAYLFYFKGAISTKTTTQQESIVVDGVAEVYGEYEVESSAESLVTFLEDSATVGGGYFIIGTVIAVVFVMINSLFDLKDEDAVQVQVYRNY